MVTLGSEHSDAVRSAHWARARAGACVVIGGRSAVWAPVPDLAAVVVLDEGDEALEDERAPTWNARDVALERAARVGAAVRVLHAGADGRRRRPRSDRRPSTRRDGPWPRVEVVDQRDEQPGLGLLSAALADALRHTVDRGARAVCVLNRRGRARLLACRTCQRAGALRGVRRDRRATGRGVPLRAVRRPCVRRCASTATARRSAPSVPGSPRVRDDLAALLPRTDVASVDAATDEVPDVPRAHRHRGGAAPRLGAAPVGPGRVPGARPGAPRAAGPGRRAGALVARPRRPAAGAPLRRTPVASSCRPGCRSTRWCRRRARAIRCAVVDAETRLAVRRSASRRSADSPRCRAAPTAVAAACDAAGRGGASPCSGRSPTGRRVDPCAAAGAVVRDALRRARVPGVDAARAQGRLRIDVDPSVERLRSRRSAGSLGACRIRCASSATPC